MVRAIELVLILFFGLVSISADDLDNVWEVQPEYSIQPEDYLQLKALQSLGNEFAIQFQNISVMDLQSPTTVVPGLQDLQCLADMQRLMKGLRTGRLWAIKMFDSWGTLPTGIFYFNRYSLGNYKECVRINKKISETQNVRGKYCLAQLPLLTWPANISMQIGVCFPASCRSAQIDTMLSNVIKKLIRWNLSGKMIFDKNCRTDESKPLDGLTIFTIVLLSIFGGLALLATLWDYFVCQDQKQLPQLVKIFSIRATSRAVFRVTASKSNPNVIDCLHGIRCMSLFWIVFAHEYMYGLDSPYINQISTLLWYQRAFSRIILEARFSVDTFFFLSGFLLFMIGLRNMEKTKGKLNVPMMYLHRYLRLTPLLIVAILIYLKFTPLFDDGPLARPGVHDFSKCAWPWTFLYVQNYVTDDMCLEHSWYLAADMQLYIISPLMLYALYKWGKKAAFVIAIIIVLLTIWLFTIMMVYDYSVFPKKAFFRTDDSLKKIYYATHQHATPWLIGALFGYFMHVIRGKTIKIHPIIVLAGWLISLAICFTSIFALFPYVKWFGDKLTKLDDSLYYSLTRIAWPLALCWVVFACVQGYGGMADSFLSSPLWQPLSRLSYAVYIMHTFMQSINFRGIQSAMYFSNYEMMLHFWGNFGFTVIICYVLHVIVEAPMGGLENMILSRFKSTPKPAASKPIPEIKENLSAVQLESQMEIAEKPKDILD